MKRVICSSLAVLCLLVLAEPGETKGRLDKQVKNKVRTTEVVPTSGSTTVISPQINTSCSSVTTSSQPIITTTSGSSQTMTTTTQNSTSVIGSILNRNRSNSGGMMRGLDRARQVQEMNKMCRTSTEQTVQSGVNSTQTQTQVTTPKIKGKKQI